MSSSLMKPILVRQLPSLPPLARWNSRAFWSWSCVIRLSFTSISPRRTDIRSYSLGGLHPMPTLTKDDEERSRNFVARFEIANTCPLGQVFLRPDRWKSGLASSGCYLAREMLQHTPATHSFHRPLPMTQTVSRESSEFVGR